MYIYCRVPEGWGLHKTTRPPGRDETQSINFSFLLLLLLTDEGLLSLGLANYWSINEKDGPKLDLFLLRQGEPGMPHYIPFLQLQSNSHGPSQIYNMHLPVFTCCCTSKNTTKKVRVTPR